MWLPSPAESQTPKEPQEDARLLHPCHRKHIAVCQQETLSFIELQPPVTPKLNGLGASKPTASPDSQCTKNPLNGFKQTLNELNDMQNCSHRTNDEDTTTLTLNSHTVSLGHNDPECHNGLSTSSWEQMEKPHSVTSVCRPLHAALSLPLSLPLSSLYTNRDSWETLPCSSSSPECSGFQSPDSYQLQRRTSQGSVKEKSISACTGFLQLEWLTQQIRLWRMCTHFLLILQSYFSLFSGRKMQVYSPEILSDESLGSPILDPDYIFPGPFASFLEEDLSGLSSLEGISSPSTDGVPDLPNLCHDNIFNLPSEPLQIIEDSVPGVGEDRGSAEASSATGVNSLSRSRQGDQERRRFSASELISRLQLSQRKNSFTLKLGKSLSARVASRDRQGSSSLSPNSDCEYTAEKSIMVHLRER